MWLCSSSFSERFWESFIDELPASLIGAGISIRWWDSYVLEPSVCYYYIARFLDCLSF